jgi:hypothetical protein
MPSIETPTVYQQERLVDQQWVFQAHQDHIHGAKFRADILCLQEVNGQEEPGQPRRLLALAKLLANC